MIRLDLQGVEKTFGPWVMIYEKHENCIGDTNDKSTILFFREIILSFVSNSCDKPGQAKNSICGDRAKRR